MVTIEFEFRWGDWLLSFPSDEEYRKWLYLLFKNNPKFFHRLTPKPVQPSFPEDHDFGDLSQVANLSSKLSNAKAWMKFRQESIGYKANLMAFEDAMSRGDKGVFKGIEWLEDLLPCSVRHKDVASPEKILEMLENA